MSAYFARFGSFNQVLPKEGPKVFGFNLDFRTLGSQDVDLSLQVQQEFISFVQGWFIDNSLNAAAVSISTTGTNQGIRIPAGKQAYMPMFITDECKLTITTTPAANLIVPFYVTNVPVMPYVW